MKRHGGRARALDSWRVNGLDAEPCKPERALLPALAQNLDDLALAYCYQFHVIRPGPAVVTQDKAVLTSMRALGALSYSKATHSAKIQEEAFNYYLAALRMVNTALQSPANIKQDSTLLAVVSLSCFESLTGDGKLERSMEAWSVHIQGLSAIIAQRGAMQFQTMAGRILFFQACAFIVGDCIRAGVPVPGPVHRLMAIVAERDVRWRGFPLLFEAANLKAKILSGELTETEQIIVKAQSLDFDFATAYDPTPDGFDFDTIIHQSRMGSRIPNYLYSYRNSIAATMWNTMRCGRLLCNGIMVDTWQVASQTDFSAEIKRSRDTILHLQMDMLASLPQDTRTTGVPSWETAAAIFGDVSTSCDQYPELFVHQGELTPTDLPTLDLGRGYAQMWNLVLAGRLAAVGGDIRTAICRVFDLIERKRDLAVASRLKTALQEGHAPSILRYYWGTDDSLVARDSWEGVL